MTAIVFAADGTEECEALLVVDILRRAGVAVSIAAVGGKLDILSSHQVVIRADVLAEEADIEHASAIILPGGMPGTEHLEQSPTVRKAVQTFMAENRLTAAICAAPGILGHMGLIEGRRATSHPMFLNQLGGAHAVPDQEVVSDGNLITASGLGAAIPFALALAGRLAGPEAAERVRSAIGYKNLYSQALNAV